MKVFVLLKSFDYTEDVVMGVFSSRESAEKHLDISHGCVHDYSIQEALFSQEV